MQLDLGNNIRQLRHRDKRTQEALADVLGVTSQAVSRWESGGSYPDMNLIPSIANYFGVSIDELFGYTNNREQRIDALAAEIHDMRRKNNGVDNNITECIGRPQTTKDDIPANFYKHYPSYAAGNMNVSELARICGLSRPTVYKYLKLL